jgi:hypothetical protein
LTQAESSKNVQPVIFYLSERVFFPGDGAVLIYSNATADILSSARGSCFPSFPTFFSPLAWTSIADVKAIVDNVRIERKGPDADQE